MGLMAQRPRVPLRNPYLISLSKQRRLCPICGKPTRLNGAELTVDMAYEVCDTPGCRYVMTIVAPEWARVGDDPKPKFKVIDGGRA